MKELTIEEKARAYDEALERARAINSGKDIDVEAGTTTCEYIFPELKESEDEKIRKELIEHIKANQETDYVLFQKFSPEDVIAWLEKQGEKPQGKSALEAWKEKKVDNRNKVESAWNNGYCNGYIQAVEKASEWLENHNDYIDVKDGNITYFDMGKCVEDFKKHMKGDEK